MEDKEFREQYKKEFDAICASDGLKSAVKNLKPQKPRKVVTPFKATIGTVAAAIMIFAAVSDYSFEKDTSGVISETVVSTPLPEAKFASWGEDEAVQTSNQEDEQTQDVVEYKGTGNSLESVATTPEKKANKPATTAVPEKKTNKPVATVAAVERGNDKASQTKPTQNETIEHSESVTGEHQRVDDTNSVQSTEVNMVSSEQIEITGQETDAVIMPLNEDGPAPRSVGGEAYVPPTVEKWTLDRYYEYLGVNVSHKISGYYTGADSFEFEIGSDGVPLDDTAVLTFATADGTILNMTVSKHVLFDSTMSGTVSESGNGYNAYKISGGVYYNIYAVNTTKDALTQIIGSL